MSKLKVIEKKGYEYTYTTLEKSKENDRGIGAIIFEDRYQQKCSIQDSSLASESAIWIGIDNTGPFLPGPSGENNENIPGRMHLTQSMVKQILPYLIEFAKTGTPISDMPIKKDTK